MSLLAFCAEKLLFCTLIVTWLSVHSDATTECNNYEECADETINDDYVRCNGYYSCDNSDITADYNIHASGFAACDSASMEAGWSVTCQGLFACIYTKTLVASSFDANCAGYGACYSSTVTAGRNVLCEGDISCYDIDITASSGDVTCSASSSCSRSTISASDDISCSGPYGCFMAELVSTSGTIDCEGDRSCYNADITTSSSDYIYCYGNRACYYADIHQARYLMAHGVYATYGATISGVQTIYTYGYLGMAYTDIDTTGLTTFRLDTGGYYSALGMDITCSRASSCHVNCNGNLGCYALDMYCYGDCSYSCDEDCEFCPTIYDYSDELVSAELRQSWDERRHMRSKVKDEMRKKLKKRLNTFGEEMKRVLDQVKDEKSGAQMMLSVDEIKKLVKANIKLVNEEADGQTMSLEEMKEQMSQVGGHVKEVHTHKEEMVASVGTVHDNSEGMSQFWKQNWTVVALGVSVCVNAVMILACWLKGGKDYDTQYHVLQ